MELPYHLKTLQPLAGALEIISYLGTLNGGEADVDEICDELDLSDRRFNKAMRRLITKGYVQMTGDMVYRLTEYGEESANVLGVEPLQDSDDSEEDEEDTSGRAVARRMIIAMPETLVAKRTNRVVVGIDGGGANNALKKPTDMVLRLSVLNGDPFTPEEVVSKLGNDPVQFEFSVTPDAYTECRIRVQVFQLGPNPDDISVAGGMYIDADVEGVAPSEAFPVAYGSDLNVQIIE